jgi:SAM-dependent methyltransferase
MALPWYLCEPQEVGRRLAALARHPVRELRDWGVRRGFKRLAASAGGAYGEYLGIQFGRSYGRRWYPLQERTLQLVNKAHEIVDLRGKSVLCVGCRNTAEIDLIRGLGAVAVTGIDLYSLRSDILVMDMHSMQFSDQHFDVVCASHVLEHADDPCKAAGEMVRVVRQGGYLVVEVPVAFATGDIERNDLQDLGGLLTVFGLQRGDVLWSESLSPGGAPTSSAPGSLRAVCRRPA